MADTYVTIPDLTAASSGEVIDTTLVEAAVVDANAASGYKSAKVTLAQISAYVNANLPVYDGGVE